MRTNSIDLMYLILWIVVFLFWSIFLITGINNKDNQSEIRDDFCNKRGLYQESKSSRDFCCKIFEGGNLCYGIKKINGKYFLEMLE